MREKFIGLLENSFRGQKIDFTHTFIQIFKCSPIVSRGQLGVFSRKDFPFHGKKMMFLKIFAYVSRFFTNKKSRNFIKMPSTYQV